VWCTGEIPREHPAEQPESYFHLDPECSQPDPLVDDQAIFVETPRGWAVIAGCAHSGVPNTLDYVGRLTGAHTLYALAGGLHLSQASPGVQRAAGDAIEQWDIQVLAPCHCTGSAPVAHLRDRFGNRVREFAAGSVLTIGCDC
jgi:7,8-dihydropterin-6-yl-methyl-4-(beta-D-ribofuranosyl)aminobenzene 5'-phosphate synthase